MILNKSWLVLLHQTLNRLRRNNQPPRVAVIGVGHELCGDDAAGILMARALKWWIGKNERMLVICAGTAPENYCGIIRLFVPDLVLLLDAAHMSEKPGVVCWLPLRTAVGISASTHTLPLHILSTYLANELSCEVALIGVQPERLSIGSKLSPVVRASITHTVQTLSNIFRDHDVLGEKKDVVNHSCPPDMVNNQEW